MEEPSTIILYGVTPTKQAWADWRLGCMPNTLPYRRFARFQRRQSQRLRKTIMVRLTHTPSRPIPTFDSRHEIRARRRSCVYIIRPYPTTLFSAWPSAADPPLSLGVFPAYAPVPSFQPPPPRPAQLDDPLPPKAMPSAL
ncbi:hypothetical protein FRB90_001141 [Tulasnella sp. 427]|nr:hypothetical protein FRB90_001141 [Tulasnella sp. 427]